MLTLNKGLRVIGVDVGDEQDEPESGVKCIITLESLHPPEETWVQLPLKSIDSYLTPICIGHS